MGTTPNTTVAGFVAALEAALDEADRAHAAHFNLPVGARSGHTTREWEAMLAALFSASGSARGLIGALRARDEAATP